MNLNLSGLTPRRQVAVRWDIDTNLIAEPAYLLRRSSEKDIFPTSATGLEKLASNLWVLRPVNNLKIINESSTANAPYIIRLADWSHIAALVEHPRHRSLTELLDISPHADVASSGDYYITKAVDAGGSWELVLEPVEAGPLAPDIFNYPFDPVAQAPITGVYPEDQAFLIRLILPSAIGIVPDVLFGFRFGGAIHGRGFGRFEAILTGDGIIALYERYDGAWHLVRQWRAIPVYGIGSSVITLRIIPHAPRYIEFRIFAGQGINPSLVNLSDASLGENLIAASEHSVLESFVFDLKDRPSEVAIIGEGPYLRPITGPGNVIVSIRRDVRLSFQVARIQYSASGTLIDRPFTIPGGFNSNRVVRIVLRGHQPVGDGTITGDVTTGAGGALPSVAETFTLNTIVASYTGRTPPGGSNTLRANVTLTNTQGAGNRWRTPVLEGYDIQRHVTQGTLSLGEKTGGNLTDLFVTGPTYRPDSETASLQIEDPKNELGVVRTRRTPVLIETTVDAAGVQKAVLFSGWTDRVNAVLKGKHGRTYPREAHRQLSCELIGMWSRLANNKYTWQMIDLADTSTHPLGRGGNAKVSWKVTDAIWWVLYSSGHPATELDIPDDPIRFFVSKTGGHEDTLKIMPGTPNIGAMAVEWARRYLNSYLVWDGGAGAAGKGMWRLLRPPTASATPLCSFTLAECPAGKLPHLSASYGLVSGKPVYPILDAGGVQYRAYTERPETNLVTVLGRVQVLPTGGRHQMWQQWPNFTSWPCPGREGLADPTSPDWLGECWPIEVHDESLPTQEAVNYVTRRIGEAAGRGRRMHQFAAECVILNVSGTETFHTSRNYRPLRPGDPVNFIDMDGNVTLCVVHSANFSVEKSHLQMGFYELEEHRAGVTIGRGPV